MRKSITIVGRLIGWGLGLAGALALVLGGMIATPLVHPPELKSISETVGRVDRSTMPALQRFS
ncbi:MAG: alpha/beta hydrolase, partial [Bradyrhizobium sp.]|nr:alpha/beta hydrolase [Bradyrhizobium sp.]